MVKINDKCNDVYETFVLLNIKCEDNNYHTERNILKITSLHIFNMNNIRYFSIISLGYVFHIAADIGPPAAFAFDRIEDAVVQADEVDGQYLQFEGGLSITSIYLVFIICIIPS